MDQVAIHVRFLRRCHRRWIVWRIAECAAIGMAIGSAVGFFILPLLFLRAQPTVMPASVVLSIGAVAGAFFGLTRRPTLVQTALETDRQLKLNDLLSTAVMSSAKAIDDEFAEVVRRQAEEICRGLSPNELIVRRLGGRAWGGIGIASSLLLTLAMMTTQPAATQARVDELAVNANDRNIPVQSIANPRAQKNQAERQASRRADQTDRRAQDHSLDERDDHVPGRAQNRSASRGSGNGNAADDASGSTAGQTNDASIPRLVQSTDSTTNDADGKLLPGSGGAGQAAPGDPTPLATGEDVPGQSPAPAPWQSATWDADRAEAIQTVQSGKTPDAYRNMIREYFDAGSHQ